MKGKPDRPEDYLKRIIHDLGRKSADQKNPAKLLAEIRHLYSLLEITRAINTSRDFDQLLELIVDSAITLTKAERGFLILIRPDGDLEFKVHRNISKKTINSEQFKISRTVVNQVLATSEPLFLGAIHRDKSFKISKSIETLGLRMVMCVPLRARDRLLGAIYVDARTITESFGEVDEKLFEAFAAQASVAIDNSHLYESSVHDNLTGLYNYGYLRIRLEEEINRGQRYNRDTISFIMIDLDKFKAINDSYGHQLGNTVLISVANLIKSSLRKSDIPVRYGGDEFAILIPETNALGARRLAERLQKEIANLKFPVGDEQISITSSIGISTFPLEKITDGEGVIVEADHALFVAKNKGGNQIAMFGPRRDEMLPAPELVGKSKTLEEVRKTLSRFAKTDTTLLIMGETGTGKELVTNLIHSESARAENPLVVVDCGAIPANLLDRELFGYEKGAFAGAYAQRKGPFETACGGTIFLDEIGELPLHLQTKILRVLEHKEIDRIGSREPIKVDVRVIAATNKNLADEVKNTKFRKDLYHRLSVAVIYLPPLRERREDIEVIGQYYLDQMNRRYRRSFAGFTKDAKTAMLNHHWPGNVRELIHRVERAVTMDPGAYLDVTSLGLVTHRKRQKKPLKDIKER